MAEITCLQSPVVQDRTKEDQTVQFPLLVISILLLQNVRPGCQLNEAIGMSRSIIVLPLCVAGEELLLGQAAVIVLVQGREQRLRPLLGCGQGLGVTVGVIPDLSCTLIMS